MGVGHGDPLAIIYNWTQNYTRVKKTHSSQELSQLGISFLKYCARAIFFPVHNLCYLRSHPLTLSIPSTSYHHYFFNTPLWTPHHILQLSNRLAFHSALRRFLVVQLNCIVVFVCVLSVVIHSNCKLVLVLYVCMYFAWGAR